MFTVLIVFCYGHDRLRSYWFFDHVLNINIAFLILLFDVFYRNKVWHDIRNNLENLDIIEATNDFQRTFNTIKTKTKWTIWIQVTLHFFSKFLINKYEFEETLIRLLLKCTFLNIFSFKTHHNDCQFITIICQQRALLL